MSLFRKAWSVQVDTLDVSALDLEFKILRSIKAVPNKCVLTLWNLNNDHRAQLLKRTRPNGTTKGISVQIEAGYVGQTQVLFSGDLREVAGLRDETNRKIVITGDDGGRSYREARINTSFAGGTPISEVFRQCALALGIGVGNSANFSAEAAIIGMGANLSGPKTLSGGAAAALTELTQSMGLTWSVQSGALQILRKGKALQRTAILLSPNTGLIGSPQSTIDSTVSLGNPQQFAAGALGKNPRAKRPVDPGILRLQTLLLPGLVPGAPVVVQSAEFNGGYVLTEVESTGQTWSNEWQHNCIARIY